MEAGQPRTNERTSVNLFHHDDDTLLAREKRLKNIYGERGTKNVLQREMHSSAS